MGKCIVLFDIDGTLLSADGAGRRAIEHVLAEHIEELPSAPSVAHIDFAGRTDPWILEQILASIGLAVEAEVVTELLARYVERLPVELERADGFCVLPGAHALVETLAARDDVVLGVGTGNAEAAAYAKLRRGGLHGFFSFGGFGSDHADRAELLRVGFSRGRAHTTVPTPRRVVVGDTPHDVSAARATGALSIAVCTGSYRRENLEAAGADHVVDSLLDEAIVETILGSAALVP